MTNILFTVGLLAVLFSMAIFFTALSLLVVKHLGEQND